MGGIARPNLQMVGVSYKVSDCRRRAAGVAFVSKARRSTLIVRDLIFIQSYERSLLDLSSFDDV